MAKRDVPNSAAQLLGQRIAACRLAQNMTRLQLGKVVNQTQRQIEKYEHGALVPLAMLEKIAVALDEPIPKRLIRQISTARKQEFNSGDESTTLAPLYEQIL